MTTRDERDALAAFRERYAVPRSDVTALVERRVIGAAWGANGYTTVEQADVIADRLGLAPGKRLLDMGTGRGWPGIYLAAKSGCALVGTDMPHDALLAASRRARAEGLAGRVALAVAAGERQPFRPASFDAVVHTDVLC